MPLAKHLSKEFIRKNHLHYYLIVFLCSRISAMAYAPPPAEEFSESDDDDFGFFTETTTQPSPQVESQQTFSGGFGWGSNSVR